MMAAETTRSDTRTAASNEGMDQYQHPSAVAELQDVCALRFLGYEYEATIPKSEQQANCLPLWSTSICERLILYTDPMKNFAAFFALQRFLGKWGGEALAISAKERIAFDFLFLHLYTIDVPSEFQHAGYMRQWSGFTSTDIESAAAYVRKSFYRY